MKILYLDCFAGVSGDMLLGALVDVGVAEDRLRTELAKLDLDGFAVQTRRVVKQNIAAVKFDVWTTGHATEVQHGAHSHRGYREIVAMIDRSKLSVSVKRRAGNVFRRIAEAEARIHQVPVEQVHFHEIGAVDSIVDIVGTCVALELLGVEQVQARPPPLGTGFVETAHGRFPVPAPATLELLRGVPVASSAFAAELVTPTGAALLVEFCESFGPMPALTIERIGYGAGSRDLKETPNVLRVVLGEAATVGDAAETDSVVLLETNLDDANPQWCGALTEELWAAGALDVWVTPVQMKKQRPGVVVSALAAPGAVDRLAEVMFRHSTTFGVRSTVMQRRKLAREQVEVETPFGKIEVKVGRLAGKILTWAPEYESCRAAARQSGVPVRWVWEAAMRCRHD
ncbi:MAG: nickel pincer cofactor biosynthesis protein LarC [Verrucomicrobiae bacterium]|nr:nickel pincer cofactor biosynthesis protein LarC [Verrucomicrobiae bacterium]